MTHQAQPQPVALLPRCVWCNSTPEAHDESGSPRKIACTNAECPLWRKWFNEADWAACRRPTEAPGMDAVLSLFSELVATLESPLRGITRYDNANPIGYVEFREDTIKALVTKLAVARIVEGARPRHPSASPTGVGTGADERQAFKTWADVRGVWPRLTHEEIFIAGFRAAAAPTVMGLTPKELEVLAIADEKKKWREDYFPTTIPGPLEILASCVRRLSASTAGADREAGLVGWWNGMLGDSKTLSATRSTFVNLPVFCSAQQANADELSAREHLEQAYEWLEEYTGLQYEDGDPVSPDLTEIETFLKNGPSPTKDQA